MTDLRDSGEFDRGRGQRAAHHAGLRWSKALERSPQSLLLRQRTRYGRDTVKCWTSPHAKQGTRVGMRTGGWLSKSRKLAEPGDII